MGGRNSCVKKQSQPQQPKLLTVAKSNSDTVITSKHPQRNSKDQPNLTDVTFPRYPVLPSIEKSNQPAITCSNGDTLAQGDSSAIMNLYNRYVDCELGFISAEGIERLCNDLNISPEDFRILVLAYCLGAEVMCRFTEDEFVNGCKKLNITDVASMKASIPTLVKSVAGSGFPPFYRWTYKFALEPDSGQRSIPIDLAISLWKLVFTNNVPIHLNRWLIFLERNSSVRSISKDTWDMFLVFVDQIKGDLTTYDDTEAWPSLLDEFVEHELEQYEKVQEPSN